MKVDEKEAIDSGRNLRNITAVLGLVVASSMEDALAKKPDGPELPLVFTGGESPILYGWEGDSVVFTAGDINEIEKDLIDQVKELCDSVRRNYDPGGERWDLSWGASIIDGKIIFNQEGP